MIQMLFLRRCQHAVPLNVVRQDARSNFYIGLPRFLKIGEVNDVIVSCVQSGERRGALIEGGAIQGVVEGNKGAPRLFIKLSVWRCQEASLRDELLFKLPPLLRASLIPVVRL